MEWESNLLMQTELTQEKGPDSEWQPRPSPPNKHRGYLVAGVLAVVFLVAAIIGIASRFSERKALAKETETLAVASVSVIHPKAEPPQEELVLPSTLQAYTESPIYARTNGYLNKWYKDIGSRVKQGELLAEIETPEVDQELLQAKAARDQASAQVEIAKSSAKRWENLQKMDAVAQQETDERNSGYAQAQANLSCRRCKCPAPAADGIVQAYLRTICWRDYQAQYRYWGADQFWQHWAEPATL